MEEISIWQGLIGLLILFALYAIPIALANRAKTLTRKPYAIRTVGFLVLILVIGVLGQAVGQAEGATISGLIGLVFAIFMILWSVHRTQDIGWSKWWCLLFIIPVVAFVFWLVLLFKPSRSVATLAA